MAPQDEPRGQVAPAAWVQTSLVLVVEGHLFVGEGHPVWHLDPVVLDLVWGPVALGVLDLVWGPVALGVLDQVWGPVAPGVLDRVLGPVALGDLDRVLGPVALGVLVLVAPDLAWEPAQGVLDQVWGPVALVGPCPGGP